MPTSEHYLSSARHRKLINVDKCWSYLFTDIRVITIVQIKRCIPSFIDGNEFVHIEQWIWSDSHIKFLGIYKIDWHVLNSKHCQYLMICLIFIFLHLINTLRQVYTCNCIYMYLNQRFLITLIKLLDMYILIAWIFRGYKLR